MLRIINLLFKVAVIAAAALYFRPSYATNDNGQWDNDPNKKWYESQKVTPETNKVYEIFWESCCAHGDVCQECVVHRVQREPPFKDEWWYERDGKMTRLPDHIVEFVPWTPTGKPVLFLAPIASGKVKVGDPVCLKTPGGAA